MEYTTLGETGLEVSRLCLGCATFGDGDWNLELDAASEVAERAIERGINFLDTANVYSRGRSEEIVGEIIDGRRDELVVATKVHGEMADRPNGLGLSRRHVLEQAEASLERLGTDYVDLYQLHRWDDDTPVEETLSALDHLVGEGKVRYVGASTMAGWQFEKALRVSDVEHYERFVCMQPEYSLVARHEEVNMLPVAEDEGLGVIPWSPLAAGFLSGEYGPETPREELTDPATTWRDLTHFDRPENREVLAAAREVADREGLTVPQVALAWLLSKDVVTAPIIGARTPAEVDEAVDALDVELSEADVERLEEPVDPVWPYRE